MARIVLHEVGPRDGLQMEKQVVPLERKEAWIRGLMGAGVDIVQVGSFVHPEKVPQMADTDELFRRLAAEQDARRRVLSGLVLNEKGLERGLACGVEMFCMGASASETHSRKNTGMGSDEALRRIIGRPRRARSGGRAEGAGVGAVGVRLRLRRADPRGPRARHGRAYLDAGLTSISLADTAGPRRPGAGRAAVRRGAALVTRTSSAPATSTTPTASAWPTSTPRCVSGVTSFETSFAGLGGCPFTKVAAGNVATEDFVHALQRQGVRTRRRPRTR